MMNSNNSNLGQKLFPLFLTVALTCLTLIGVAVSASPGEKLYDFVFNRSFVQYLTFITFFYAVSLLVTRMFLNIRMKSDLYAIQRNGRVVRDSGKLVNNQFEEVRKTIEETDPANGRKKANQLKQLNTERTKETYDTINSLVVFLPALGLFGTILGLSNSIFAAFSQGSLTSESIGLFVSGLSIAMDTTVLGISCSIIAGVFTQLMCKSEQAFNAKLDESIRNGFELNSIKTSAGKSREREIEELTDKYVAIFIKRFETLVSEIMSNFESKLESTVDVLTKSYMDKLSEATESAVSKHYAANRQVMEEVMTRLSHEISAAIRHMEESIKTQNSSTAEVFRSEIRRLESIAKTQVPSELVLKFTRDKSNGSSGHESHFSNSEQEVNNGVRI
jgi:biopolymer transport protein ExbB/TolQ